MMKKFFYVLAVIATTFTADLFAGDDQTNTNQSASYVRNPSRDASTEIDAVYYNPAGLTKLDNGLSFSISNQTIYQKKGITSNYPFLNGSPNAKYTGDITVLFFPCIYAAYKLDKLVFSMGFNPIGGGGEINYSKGLPSLEMSISDFKPMLAATAGVTDYSAKINFKGGSSFYGIQAGVSYEINPMISIFGGVRYVIVKNTITGSIKDIMINPGGGSMVSAIEFFNSISRPDLAAVSDQDVDVQQSGTGITPIIGINLVPVDKLNIGIKYEFATRIELKNKTSKDLIIGIDPGTNTPITMFPDGSKVRSDMAAMLSIGASYKVIPSLTASVGFHLLFDKNVNFGKQDSLGQYVDNSKAYDKNYIDIMAGLDYKITDRILISGGYQYSQAGIKKEYQRDMSNYLSSSNIGVGGSYAFTPKMIVNIGVMFVDYYDFTNNINHELGTVYVPVKEKYSNTTYLFSVGLDYSFGE
jgi:long-chain fatty acid transport protein